MPCLIDTNKLLKTIRITSNSDKNAWKPSESDTEGDDEEETKLEIEGSDGESQSKEPK